MARDLPAQRRIAVVLFNLGGPDGPKAVRPFLFNLFRDKAIIAAPAAVRYPLAALISGTRAKAARANYALMGGGSPLLPETERQAGALKAALERAAPADVFEVFIAMRYWKPLTGETATWPTRTPSTSATSDTLSAPASRKARTICCSLWSVCGASRNAAMVSASMVATSAGVSVRIVIMVKAW